MSGVEAYPDVFGKSAALLHSLVTGHPLVDGNRGLGWLATVVFLDLNGVRWHAVSDDDVEALVVAISAGTLSDVDKIAEELRRVLLA